MENKEIIRKIKKEIPFIDIKPYSHNIIGLLLSHYSAKNGKKETNELIKNKFPELLDLGWNLE